MLSGIDSAKQVDMVPAPDLPLPMTALHWATCANVLTLSLFYWHSVYIDELLSTVYMCACVCLYVYVWYGVYVCTTYV